MPHRRITATLSLALVLVSSAIARADGKFYARERVPPNVPYQRAILLFDDGKETLLLQSQFSASGKPEPGAALGWVVPVPAEPELGSMKADKADDLYFSLVLASQSRVVIISEILFLGLPVIGILLLVVSSIRWKHGGEKLATYGGLCLVSSFVILVVSGLFVSLSRSKGLSPGVDVLNEEIVGIYQAKVIKAVDSSGLVAWLNEGGFQFTSSDQPVLDDYIQKSWCFVVAQVKPGEEKKAQDTYEGLADPLILRFASKSPVYPLALTGTTGAPTEVLLYTLSRSKLDTHGVLALRYAGITEAWSEALDRASRDAAAAWKPQEWERNLTYLCKFKGTLTPAQMASDLELVPAADNAPYRERIVKW